MICSTLAICYSTTTPAVYIQENFKKKLARTIMNGMLNKTSRHSMNDLNQ